MEKMRTPGSGEEAGLGQLWEEQLGGGGGSDIWGLGENKGSYPRTEGGAPW